MCKGLVVGMWHMGEQKGVLKSWSRETGREFLNDLAEASRGSVWIFFSVLRVG